MNNNNNLHDIPLGKAPRRVRQMLNGLLASKQLTPEGLKWLVSATDPFHDEPIACEGYPDLTTSSVLTQTVQYTTSVSAPSTVQPGQPFDVHVFFNPVTPPLGFTPPGAGLSSTDSRLLQYGVTSTGQVIPTSSVWLYSGVNAVACPAGTNIFTAPGGQVPTPSIAFQQTFASGNFRLIACGFEVVNTTAELYKGGSVTVYRSPSYHQLANLYSGPPTSTISVASKLTMMPPGTQAEATLFPTSRTWGASEGAYVVCTLNSDEIPFVSSLPNHQAGLITNSDVASLTTGTGNRLAYLPAPPDPSTGRTAGMNSIFPFDVSGAIFTGLNPNSTLQVTVRYVVERIPSTTEPNLLVLTRPPCPYDPLALEIYSRVIAMIAPGVKVSDNPDGEFWASVLDVIGDVLPALGVALTPVLGPVATVLGAAGSAASKSGAATVRNNAQKKKMEANSRASPANNNPPKKS